jgi:hypothetical protein
MYCLACANGPCWSCGAAVVFGQAPVEAHADLELAPPAEAPQFDYNLDVLTPEDAAARRFDLLQQRDRMRVEGRGHYRGLRNQQIRLGLRPARRRNRDASLKIISANVSGFGTLQYELQYGNALADADFLLVQEHKLHGEALDTGVRWLKAQGWDCIPTPAYFKSSDYGGGNGDLH